MATLSIEFNDAVLTGVNGGGVVFAEPGCALLGRDQPKFGMAAWRSAHNGSGVFNDRYWSDLSELPLTGGQGDMQTHADLAHAQLQQLWRSVAAGTDTVVYAVPTFWTHDKLALLLGISQEIGIPLKGLATIPLAATRRNYADGDLVHIEMCAHTTGICRMEQSSGAKLQQAELIEGFGYNSLTRSCVNYIARRFLECSRFDPLHTAASEQAVYAHMGQWLAGLKRNATTDVSLDFGGNNFSATLAAAELENWLRVACEPLIRSLRATLDTARPTAVQMDARLAEITGVSNVLMGLPGCEVFVLEPGAAARGLYARASQVISRGEQFALTTSLPWDQPPQALSAAAFGTSAARVPSHVLVNGTAYRLSEKPLRIGMDAVAGDYSAVIAASHQGVSRRHCSIEMAGGQVVLRDHSRYGTLLNGHRIEGSAVLQATDVVQIGDPACELLLINEVGPDGA